MELQLVVQSKRATHTATLQYRTGCLRDDATVNWVAYRSGWARGTRGGRREAPRRLPSPRQSDRQPNRLSCHLLDTLYAVIGSIIPPGTHRPRTSSQPMRCVRVPTNPAPVGTGA